MTSSFEHFPQAVLFDWDNTLVDTTRGCYHAINTVLSAFGKKTHTFEEFVNSPSISVRNYFKEIFTVHEYDEAQKLFFHHAERLSASPFTYAYPLLNWLKAVGVPMAVVSNKEGVLLRREIDKLGWSDYFYCAVGSYDTHEDKPSPVPLLHALSQKPIAPSPYVWFVGDSIVDMSCAHKAGCTPVSVGEQADTHPHPLIQAVDCKGLLDLLQKRYYEQRTKKTPPL